MSVKKLVKQALPSKAVGSIARVRDGLQRAKLAGLPPLSESDLTAILTRDLQLVSGDTVFIHSSMDQLNPAFPFYRILSVLREVVGASGTLLFPTYPRLSSHEFLAKGDVFDVRKSPSYTGILTEFARRQPGAVRSLHPTKSVCAIGLNAGALTESHHLSPYPYDRQSPYRKIIDFGGKVIGLGVSTRNLSFVHCVDDELKEEFPIKPYHSKLFEAKCINYEGKVETVRTYAHDLSQMRHNIPRYMRMHIPSEACQDLKIVRRNFFRVDAKQLFEAMLLQARAGVTIYSR